MIWHFSNWICLETPWYVFLSCHWGANCKEGKRKKQKHLVHPNPTPRRFWVMIEDMDHNHPNYVVSCVLCLSWPMPTHTHMLYKIKQAKRLFLHGSPSCKTSAFHPDGRRCPRPPPWDSERIMTIPSILKREIHVTPYKHSNRIFVLITHPYATRCFMLHIVSGLC